MDRNVKALLPKLNLEELNELLHFESVCHQEFVQQHVYRIAEIYRQRHYKRTPRAELETLIVEIAERNENVFYHILELFPYKTALEPVEAEMQLGITKYERTLMTKAGKLPVIDIVRRIRFGKRYEYPIYPYLIAEIVPPNQIEEWRRIHEEEKIEHYRQGYWNSVEKKQGNEIHSN